MKYGLILFKKSENLGDDIQSYAAMQFLPSVDYIIEREHLDDFCPATEEKVAVILSGWYLYNHLNWPPSPYLYTLPVSIHFDTEESNVLGKDITQNNVMKGFGREWLKRNEPIGARDWETQKLISENGIESYFSSCLTLTLCPYKNLQPHNRIVAVDVGKEVVQYLSSRLKTGVVERTHKIYMKNYEFAERMNMVEERLKFYQGACLVITKRLHAALPCLALGTPVLLVLEENISNRLKTYCSYLNVVKETDLLAGNCNYYFDNPLDNPNKYQYYATALREVCTNYINVCQGTATKEVTPREVFKDSISRTNQLKQMLIDELNIDGEKELYKLYS